MSDNRTRTGRRFSTLAIVVAELFLTSADVLGEHYSFIHYGPNEGLNAAVKQLLQDDEGFLWVGTSNGLFRYDGEHFQRFGPAEGLPGTGIRAVHKAPDGSIWSITGRGLVHFTGKRFEAVDTGVSADSLESSLDFDAGGRLFVASRSGVLVGTRDSAGGHYTFRPLPGGPQTEVNSVYAEPDGTLWFGCGLELCRTGGGSVRTLGKKDGIPPDSWGAILRDRQGVLWIRGIRHLYVSAGNGLFMPREEGLAQSSNSALSMALDQSGRVLVSTDAGLGIWTGAAWQVVGSAQGLESDAVTAMLQDREGSLWIGMWGAGVARWIGYGEWTSWTKNDGLVNSLIWAIRRDASGELWVGTDNGLVRFKGVSPSKAWNTSNGFPGNKVRSLEIEPGGTILAGLSPGGLARLNPATGAITRFGSSAGIEDDHLIALHRDRAGYLYVAATTGLYRSTAAGEIRRFEAVDLPDARPRTMFFRFRENRAGQLWVGSTNGLYCRSAQGAWTRYTTADGLKSNAVTHVVEAADGSMWFGYREPLGLSRMWSSDGHIYVEHVSKKDGLGSDYILFLGLDAARNMWVGTDEGVDARINGHWVHHDRNDGMVSSDCAANAFLADADGGVWIGTLKGLSHYHPANQAGNRPPPPVVILGAEFGGRAANVGAPLKIAFRDHDFRVLYAGLTFRNEKNARFRYRLAGLESDWTDTSLREARYASLPAGEYVFEVLARSADGLWSTAPARVSFRVLPPLWQTWWARGLMTSAFLSLLGCSVRIRIRKFVTAQQKLEKAVQERTAELEGQKSVVERQKGEIEDLLEKSQESSRLKGQFLANMSHEIRTPMNGIIGMAEIVLSTALNAEQRDCLSTVRTSAESLLTVINDILDFSKIDAGKMELAHERFCLRECLSNTLRLLAWKAREKNLEFAYTVARDVPDELLGDSGRLRQVVLNLVGNSMKFTECGSISLSVGLRPRHGASGPQSCELLFTIRDTGIGVPVEKQSSIFEPFSQVDNSSKRLQGGTGLGLAICAKLVSLMDGKIWVESTPGEGSAFHFTGLFGVAEPSTDPERDSLMGSVRGRSAALAIANPTRRMFLEEELARWGVRQVCVEECDFVIVDRDAAIPKTLLQDRKDSSPPTIVLSDSWSDTRAVAGVRHLARLVNPRELLAALSELTLHSKPACAITAAEPLPRTAEPLGILLVEDNPINQKVARLMLEKLGHRVETADNGLKATEIVQRSRFDVVLMDMQMPVMDGYEAARRIRDMERLGELPSGRHLPIIAMTAHAMAGDRETCLEAGMDDYISKPIDSASLHKLLEQHRRAPAIAR